MRHRGFVEYNHNIPVRVLTGITPGAGAIQDYLRVGLLCPHGGAYHVQYFVSAQSSHCKVGFFATVVFSLRHTSKLVCARLIENVVFSRYVKKNMPIFSYMLILTDLLIKGCGDSHCKYT